MTTTTTEALLGTMLQIKPVMHMDDEGHLIPVSKARGRKASLQALDCVVERELLQAAVHLGELPRLVAQKEGARVGDRVDGMSEAVDEARAVAGLLADNLCDVVGHLAFVRPVPDVLLHLRHLAHRAQVCAAVAAALQRERGGGGGRYDKMIGKFTGNDVPACGFSIGFERIILLLMESGFKIPESPKKVAYLVEKKYPADKLVDVMNQAKEARANGQQVLVVRMNKNKKFQKEQLTKDGYEEFVEFFNR